MGVVATESVGRATGVLAREGVSDKEKPTVGRALDGASLEVGGVVGGVTDGRGVALTKSGWSAPVAEGIATKRGVVNLGLVKSVTEREIDVPGSITVLVEVRMGGAVGGVSVVNSGSLHEASEEAASLGSLAPDCTGGLDITLSDSFRVFSSLFSTFSAASLVSSLQLSFVAAADSVV